MEQKFTYDYWMESTGVLSTPAFSSTIYAPWNSAGGKSASACPPLSSCWVRGREFEPYHRDSRGETTRPLKFALDEVVYVVAGRGLTTIWYDKSGAKSFEWQQHSMFLLPHGCHHTFSNMQGEARAAVALQLSPACSVSRARSRLL